MRAVTLVVPLVLRSGRRNNAGQALEEKKIYGVSGARGVVEGRVKIVKSLDTDQYKFEKGDILVTYCTSSSFCLLLSQSAAVITEEGGALSHAAITARELHIPAVVSAKNAAQVLQDGMLVRVDGTAGVVEIL
jgi:phosphohistidine swiveling domain-containing protein